MMPSSDDSGVVAAGTVLAGRYRVAEVLGSGGMGRVYRGEHTAFGKPVAIKVLHRALGSNEEAAIRFQREAVASGRLDHPNIVSVMDFGTLDDGSMYLVMEALEGEHLGKRLDRDKRIAWPEAVTIMRSVLLGLHHAHDRGVVHRDIKPDNVFLANKAGEIVVKVLDFGIAKLYAETKESLTATRAGITVGTPRYISPEQAVGGSITPACDVYSSSVLLYEMIVGRAPFEEEEPLAQLMAHVSREVPSFREIAPDVEVPSVLEDVVRHGLAKTAAQRIPSALDYVHELDDVLRANGYEPPPIPTARSSQTMDAVGGASGVSTPARGVTKTTLPAIGAATPLPFAATMAMVSSQSTPTKSERAVAPVVTPAAVAATVAPPPAKKRIMRGWLGVAAIGLVGGVVAAVLVTRGSHDAATKSTPDVTAQPAKPQAPAAPTKPSAAPAKPVATPPPATTSTAPSPTPPAPATATPSSTSHAATLATTAASEAAHAATLKSALHALHTGTHCIERKAAIPKLVALHDATAIPELKKARARPANACLRASADEAIKKLAAHP